MHLSRYSLCLCLFIRALSILFVNTEKQIIHTIQYLSFSTQWCIVQIRRHLSHSFWWLCSIPLWGPHWLFANTNGAAVSILVHVISGIRASVSVGNNSAFLSKSYPNFILPVSTRLPRHGPHWLPPLSLHSLNTYNVASAHWHTQRSPVTSFLSASPLTSVEFDPTAHPVLKLFPWLL